jgi:hypothetical protein
MKIFIKNFAFFSVFGITPVLIIALVYLFQDPFKVLYSYNDYSNSFVVLNRDYISTEMFVKNHFQFKYNSFILGSSRTLAFKPSSWIEYLEDNDRAFMFDASGESIYGVYTKLIYLDSLEIEIDNVLIILCRDQFFRNSSNHTGHLYIKHPLTSKESNFKFHYAFVKAFLDPTFLFNYLTYLITKDYKSFMRGYIENRIIIIDKITNELSIVDLETELEIDPNKYYQKNIDLFYERKGEQIDSLQRINHKQVEMCKKIKRILEKHNTNYKVVISPLYDQINFSETDQNILTSVFGNHLYDFSGKNEFTDNKFNYYETSHFRPFVGDSILKIIYK